MPTLPRFEFQLNQILRCLLGQISYPQVSSFFMASPTRPRCLSRACVELVEDTLRKGLTHLLASDGAARERFLHAEDPADQLAEGRIWERHDPREMGLMFSRRSLELLIWLTAEPVNHSKIRPNLRDTNATIGDRWLEWLVASRVCRELTLSPFLIWSEIQSNPLIRLCVPHLMQARFDVSRTAVPDDETDWAMWFRPETSWILEALQKPLAAAIVEADREKLTWESPEKILALGELQRREINFFLDAADAAGRRDLAAFLLTAARQCLQHPSPINRLDVSAMTLHDRVRTYEADLSLFRIIERLESWNQEARSAGFYDENYRASQQWKSTWDERDGERLIERARNLLQAARVV